MKIFAGDRIQHWTLWGVWVAGWFIGVSRAETPDSEAP